jgi:hypothetical protein
MSSPEPNKYTYLAVEGARGTLGKIVDSERHHVALVDDEAVEITLTPEHSSERNALKKWAAQALGKNYKITIGVGGDNAPFPVAPSVGVAPETSEVAAAADAPADSGVAASADAGLAASVGDQPPPPSAALDGAAAARLLADNARLAAELAAAKGEVAQLRYDAQFRAPQGKFAASPEAATAVAQRNKSLPFSHPDFPGAPLLDPHLGDKTPAFVEWKRKHSITGDAVANSSNSSGNVAR